MKWVLIVVGGLVAFIALVAVVGMMLPKGHVASRKARYTQPPEAVWAAITDYEKFPSWRPDVARVEVLPARQGLPAWREIQKGGDTIPFEVVESTVNRRLVTRIADANLPFGGTWTYEISAVPGGSLLRITENGEVYNPIFRVVSRFMDMSATIRGYMSALGKRFGEEVVIEE